MNKKFLSAILFGALMVTSTGTFVSCKDYDDDIDSINKELTDIKSQLAALQSKVDAGKWITGVSSTANGLAITMSDGQTLNITNGKDGVDGAQGEAGAPGKDGKDGSVITVVDGVLCIDGVATEIKVCEEAPAAEPCVKVEDGVLMLWKDGKYVASDLKVSNVTATNTNGVWTITVGEDVITVPGSAALSSIAVQGDVKDFELNYAKLSKATPWGWKQADGTYDESMEAGFYTRLSQDVDVLLNPAEADGTAFSYTFKNSKGETADVTFFGEARPSTAVLTRAASANGLWTLPAAVTKFDAADINELRNELYLNFKQNNGPAYAMTLEAVDGLGNVAVRSDYDYTITLKQATGSAHIDDMKNCEIGVVYYPTIVGPVYDYKIRVAQTASNLRLAQAFGVEITADGKGFSAANDAAVLNYVDFEYAYVTIAGYQNNQQKFRVTFSDGMTASENLRAEEFTAPFNATLANNPEFVSKNPLLAPALIRGRLTDDYAKVFQLKHTYDLSTLYAGLSDDAKLLFNEAIGNKDLTKTVLIGGESNGEENYNSLNRNEQLRKNIYWEYKSGNKIEVTFYVTCNWDGQAAYDKSFADAGITKYMPWVEYSNFQLYTAYQLNISVLDAWNGNEIVMFELPFEFTQPTLDITHVEDATFSEWSTIDKVRVNPNTGKWQNYTEDALYVYGLMNTAQDKMMVRFYDAFTAWKAEGSETGVNSEYYAYKDGAEYYNFNFKKHYATRVLSPVKNEDFNVINLRDARDGYGVFYEWDYDDYNTFALQSEIELAVENDEYEPTYVDESTQKLEFAKNWEVNQLIEVGYRHFGVYPEFDEAKINNGFANGGDFNLVFASWLNHSTLKTKEAAYKAKTGSHTVIITNDDLNLTTPKGDAFYLFDDLKASGKIEAREDLNENAFNEIEQHPFTTVEDLMSATVDGGLFDVKAGSGKQEKIDFNIIRGTNAMITYDADGNSSINEEALKKNYLDESKVNIFPFEAVEQVGKKGDDDYKQGYPGGIVIQLPKTLADTDNVIVTINVKDQWGYTKPLEIKIKKVK